MLKKKENNEFNQFKKVTKKAIKDFNKLEARGWTIDRLQQIEYRINEKIIAFFKPEKLSRLEKYY